MLVFYSAKRNKCSAYSPDAGKLIFSFRFYSCIFFRTIRRITFTQLVIFRFKFLVHDNALVTVLLFLLSYFYLKARVHVADRQGLVLGKHYYIYVYIYVKLFSTLLVCFMRYLFLVSLLSVAAALQAQQVDSLLNRLSLDSIPGAKADALNSIQYSFHTKFDSLKLEYKSKFASIDSSRSGLQECLNTSIDCTIT